MKTRMALVSNSSSCSFTILKKDLDNHQIYMIKNYNETAKNLGMDNDASGWSIEDTGDALKLSTDMDNFDMNDFLTRIGYDLEKRFDVWHG